MRLVGMYASLWDSGSNSGERRWSIVETRGGKIKKYFQGLSFIAADGSGWRKKIITTPRLSESLPGSLLRISRSTGYYFIILKFDISSLERVLCLDL